VEEGFFKMKKASSPQSQGARGGSDFLGFFPEEKGRKRKGKEKERKVEEDLGFFEIK
jgi:hypothetical protein